MKLTCVCLAFVLARSANGLTLDAVLAQTLERNPAIQQARFAVEQAAGRRIELRSIAFPDARIAVFGGDQGGHRAGQPANQPFAFARGSFLQPVFNAAIPPSWRRGDVELLIAQQRLNIAVNEQLHGARVAFYTALYNRSLRQLGESQRQLVASNVASELERYRGGQTGRGAVTSAQVLEQELAPRIEDARRAYGGAVLALAQATGSDLSANAKLAEPEGELQLRHVAFDVDAETARALQRRADLQLARLLVRAAAEDQRIIEAAYYPVINAVATGNYIPVSEVRRDSGGSPQRANDVISSEVRAGGAFTWRVIDNGKTAGAAMRQRAIREINELTLHRLESNVPRELATIQNTLRGIDARQQALAPAETAARETVAGVQQNLAQGLASQLEFRSAESGAVQMNSALLTAAFEQNVALAEWDRATGRYFEFADDTAGKQH
jgi:outer membrane protein TolC